MDRLITKTMAEIYLRQGHLREAYEIFEALAEKDPLDPDVQERLAEIKHKLDVPAGRKPLSNEEKLRFLKKWLANIRERKNR